MEEMKMQTATSQRKNQWRMEGFISRLSFMDECGPRQVSGE
jgi:hypothetical protein